MSITRYLSLRTLVLVAGMVALLLLSACAGYGIAEVVSTSSTGKTIPDHVISLSSGKDCSVARYQNGLHYCKEDEKKLKQTQLYCYRSLGDAVCYDKPNPYDSRQLINNRDDHNRGKTPKLIPKVEIDIPPEPDTGQP